MLGNLKKISVSSIFKINNQKHVSNFFRARKKLTGMMKLSIVIPVFNEEKTIQILLAKIDAVVLPSKVQKEIIIVDDCSLDDTAKHIKSYINQFFEPNIMYLKHERNMGKGAALRLGIENSSGDIIVIQDADLEYDPSEYPGLINPILDDYADVVFGSRFIGGKPHRVLFFWHTIGNKFLTSLSNILTNLNLTDMESGHKMFRSSVLKKINLKENRFGFEPEVTAKIAKITGIRIYEVGISYYGRTYEEGKKINWKDGFRAIYCIIKYNIFN